MGTKLDSNQSQITKENITFNHLQNLLLKSYMPKQNISLDEPFEAVSFQEYVKNCEINLKKAISILENHSECIILNKHLAIKIILLCGEHSKSELWTSPETTIFSEKLLQLVVEQSNYPGVLDLLLHYKIDTVLAELRPKLLKNTWKNYPAAVTCFIWILLQIKCPHLGDVLNSVLPTCLLLIDDHEYSNKIKGLNCLQHVANNVSRAELNQYGRGSVIYNALEHMIYLRETEIIRPLGACLTALLSKTEHTSTTNTLAWSHFDDVLNIWLPSMEMEQKLLLREAYIESLDNLLQAMGLGSVRWTKQLISILSEYCEQDHTRDRAILVLMIFIKTTWPRLRSNFKSIVIILMKIVIRLSRNKDDNSSQSTLKLIRKCFTLLEALCHDEYDAFATEMKNCSDLRDCFMLITDHQDGKIQHVLVT